MLLNVFAGRTCRFPPSKQGDNGGRAKTPATGRFRGRVNLFCGYPKEVFQIDFHPYLIAAIEV